MNYSATTHVAMDVSEGDDSIDVILKLVNKYIELEPMGPFINGDLVIQGSSYQITHVPAVCKIEFAAEHEEDFREVFTIMPWEMIYQPAEGEMPDAVSIPIQLPPECRDGMVHIKVYVDDPSRVPHDNADENYDSNSSSLILALDFVVPGSRAGGFDDTADMRESPIYPVIQSLKVVEASGDNFGMNELSSGGFESCVVFDMARGMADVAGAEGWGVTWKFALGTTKSSSTSEEGIEDIIFVSKNEETSELEVPDGYEVDGLNLLALQDVPNDVSSNKLVVQ